ncbi:MAG: protein sphX [Candidatus Muproteobacteria bacterium RIFCSPHIGHO2_01_FULL_65_16]|uniref:Phosphate-binding protein n=1 Tax=Candidatus Muproteobacteria bacterium RIFCSPHIGHO2_01_FULL_65_16 TaxID=1817764 RepID=A0A1F6TI73_9PROT|nr:MAG: protein sphX [Candidatus Muproteobacteria bacterium RIFCSPHIGHO2_01_FULL_65_16]
MKLKQTFAALGMATVAVAALTGAPAPARAEAIIKVDGSSTVFPITEAVAEEFQKSQKKTKVTVGVSGTGGGFKKFCRGETDISDASRPISKKEMDICKEAGIKYVELPVAFDALTVVVNPKNDWLKGATVEELKKMWEPEAQGKVMKWSDVNPKWPNEKLALFGPGADSGTFDYFTDAINGKEKASRGDFTASEDDNVLVQGVSRDKYAIGYFGLAYYVENKDKLKALPIINKGATKAVSPSIETVMDGSYRPLARPIFIYVAEKSMAKPEVKEFVTFYLKNATKLTKEVGYVPLSPAHYDQGLKNFNGKKLGTGFGGKNEVGVRVDELLKREAHL